MPPPGSAPVSNRLTLLNIQHLTLIPGPHAEFLRQLGNKAVEMGCKSSKNKRNPKNLKSSNFRFLDFFKETFKIQILDSQSQQKIVAFQSNVFIAML